MWLWQQKPCAVCAEKDKRLQQMELQADLLKMQLQDSRLREQKAIDSLLNERHLPGVTPPARMSATDSQASIEDAMALFKDEADQGDGLIQEADTIFSEERAQ
jgi:hypothetical protein